MFNLFVVPMGLFLFLCEVAILGMVAIVAIYLLIIELFERK